MDRPTDSQMKALAPFETHGRIHPCLSYDTLAGLWSHGDFWLVAAQMPISALVSVLTWCCPHVSILFWPLSPCICPHMELFPCLYPHMTLSHVCVFPRCLCPYKALPPCPCFCMVLFLCLCPRIALSLCLYSWLGSSRKATSQLELG